MEASALKNLKQSPIPQCGYIHMSVYVIAIENVFRLVVNHSEVPQAQHEASNFMSVALLNPRNQAHLAKLCFQSEHLDYMCK